MHSKHHTLVVPGLRSDTGPQIRLEKKKRPPNRQLLIMQRKALVLYRPDRSASASSMDMVERSGHPPEDRTRPYGITVSHLGFRKK